MAVEILILSGARRNERIRSTAGRSKRVAIQTARSASIPNMTPRRKAGRQSFVSRRVAGTFAAPAAKCGSGNNASSERRTFDRAM